MILRNCVKSLLSRIAVILNIGRHPPMATVPFHAAHGKVLVIMLTHLGDCVIHFPFLGQLVANRNDNFPIHIMVKAPLADVFNSSPNLMVWPFHCPWVGAGRYWSHGLEWLRLVCRLRSEHYDLIIVTHPHIFSSLTARLIGGRAYVLGYAEPSDYLLDEALPFPSGHVSERWKVLCTRLGLPPEANSGWGPFDPARCREGAAHARRSAAATAEPDRGRGDSYICLHPGAGGPTKVWPSDNFISLLGECRWLADRAVILLGADAERDACHNIEKALSPKIRVVNLCGQFGIHELAGALGGAELYIGNDSGPSHLAAYCGTSAFVIFGPSDPATWAPSGGHVRICQVGSDVFASGASVKQVKMAFSNFLDSLPTTDE